jgi:ATP-dependent Lhr-like helicase
MSLPASSSSGGESSAFHQLDSRIQRWIWQAGWTELKDAQERAIAPILRGDTDVIIAAATASGKTEAAFFPVLTKLLVNPVGNGVALYISPLKALINDQWARLDGLCESLEIPVTPWHGDSPDSKKKHFLKKPAGCVLITPESLEALLMRHGAGIANTLRGLQYCVIDELHSFLDNARGRQLQSLLHRMDTALARSVPRIGLSATLGKMELAADFLRPGSPERVEIIQSHDTTQELQVLVKGYLDLPPPSDTERSRHCQDGGSIDKDDEVPAGMLGVGRHMFQVLRGSNNLIFPNSRGKVELYSDLLRRQCEREKVPNEFWPHHGSLSREIREETEAALKSKERPASAICTTTLELGIDIGAVKSVAQVGPAPSVASLRQRLGRSGRRKGDPAILRVYALEDPLTAHSAASDQLREGLLQSIAQINLLIRGWYEAPRRSSLHLSTLIQQILALIAQYGGITAARAWQILCQSDVFGGITKDDFSELLRELGTRKVLMQDPSGLLLPDTLGEKLVNHYSFYAAFATDEEFRIVSGGKTLGSVPISRPISEGSYVIFGGRRWHVTALHASEKVIEVVPAKGGRPPLFDGGAGKVHDEVRQEMRRVLSDTPPIPFLDKTAMQLVAEARAYYGKCKLDVVDIMQSGKDVRIFTWHGDWINDTLVLMLARQHAQATNEGLCLLLPDAEVDQVRSLFYDMARDTAPSAEDLARGVQNKPREKWDGLLPEDLLCKSFASRELDVPGAVAVARHIGRGE